MNKYAVILLMGLMLSGGLSLHAQSIRKLTKKYEYGIELLEKGNALAAGDVFSWMLKKVDHAFAAPAYYFRALCYYRRGLLDKAEADLLALIRQKPQWAEIEDAHYLLGLVRMDLARPAQSLASLAAIRTPELRQQAYRLKLHKLPLFPQDTLLRLYRETGDTTCARIAYQQELQTVPSQRDTALLRELGQLFGVEVKQKKAVRLHEEVRIAVLLPFGEDRLGTGASDKRPLQIVLDLYDGIRMGVDSLQREGIPIQLFTYDTRSDSLTTAQILAKPGMENMDFFIGPLFEQPLALASMFTNRHNIPMVNPLSEKGDWVTAPRSTFILNPTPETQARKAARLARQYLDSKMVYIVHGMSQSDSLLAAYHGQQFEMAGGKVKSITPFDMHEKRAFTQLKAILNDTQFDSVNVHVYVASENPALAINVVSALQPLKVHRPVMVPKAWLDIRQVKFRQLEQINAHILYPHYESEAQDSARTAFKWAYTARNNMIPFQQAPFLGFEAVNYFVRAILKYGRETTLKLRKAEPAPGIMLPGFDFRNAVDNQFVPLIKFVEGYPMMINAITLDE